MTKWQSSGMTADTPPGRAFTPDRRKRRTAAPRLSKVLAACLFWPPSSSGAGFFWASTPWFRRRSGRRATWWWPAVAGVPKALAQTPMPAAPKPAPAEAPAPAEKQAGPPGVLDWQELAKRKEELDRREQAVAELEARLDRRVKELAALEATLKTMLDQAQQTKDEKLKHLIDVYTNMKPKQAAEVLETLDERIAVKILAGMKGRQAGES